MHLTWIALPIAIVPVLLWLRASTRTCGLVKPPHTNGEATAHAQCLGFESARLAKLQPAALPPAREQAERWFDQRPFRL